MEGSEGGSRQGSAESRPLNFSSLWQEVQAGADEQNLLPFTRQSEAGGPGDGAEEEDGEEVGEFSDHRWRMICLHPHGKRWEEITTSIEASVQAMTSSNIGGCTNIPP